MSVDKTVLTILAEIQSRPRFDIAVPVRSDPTGLIATFQERGVAERGFLFPEELEHVALVKNGGKLSTKTRNALRSNSAETIKQLTAMALKTDEPEMAVRLLMGLDGVRLPTASCLLAWTLPHKWPVIDVRAWRTLARLSDAGLEFEPVGGLKVRHWTHYFMVVKGVAVAAAMTPQAVDVWLYHHDKSHDAIAETSDSHDL